MRSLFFLLLFFNSLAVHAKIYDCFAFFNELELLEVRLNELYDHVDKFVLVEWTVTFRGNPKPLYYEMNKERFQKFSDKIIHVVLTDHFDTPDPWVRENFQRQQIMRVLTECQPDDIIIISDADEIVRPSSLPAIIHALHSEKKDIVGCSQTLYRFFLNARDPQAWNGSYASTYGYLSTNKVDLYKARMACQWNQHPIIENAGWHFSWMGGHKRVVQKIESYAHQEEDHDRNKTPRYIQDQLDKYNCAIVTLDESYPRYMLENIEKFKQLKWIYGERKTPSFFLQNRILTDNKRYSTFQKTLALLLERRARTCIETGTARHGDKDFAGDGGSTIIFGHFAQENHAEFFSVDISEAHIREAKGASGPYLDSIQFVQQDSISFLKAFSEKIDFLYLDSFDYDYYNPALSQQHHLEEVKAALPHLTDRSIIMIDDCYIHGGGRGLLAIPFLIEQGWKVVENGYQVLLAKDYKSDPEVEWQARYKLGENFESRGDWENALYWYLEAYQCNPKKTEPLVKIAIHYRHCDQHHLACLFAKYAARIATPTWALNEAMSISAYYAGFHEDGLRAVNALVLQKDVPAYIRNQAYSNLQFYAKPLKNARFEPVSATSMQKTEKGYRGVSGNALLEYDSEFQLLSKREIIEKLPRDRIHAAFGDTYLEGMEEIRLIDHWMTCTLPDLHPSGIPKIAICELDKKAKVKSLTPLKRADPKRAEKNWLPFMKEGLLHFIASVHPFVIYQVDPKTGECKTVESYITDLDFSSFQGAAGPISFDGGYLMLVHDMNYYRFLYLDQNFIVQQMSLPFSLPKLCSDMTFDHSKQEILLCMGEELSLVDLSTIRSLLEPIHLKPIFKQDAYVPKYLWNLGFAEKCDISPFREGLPLDYRTWAAGDIVDPARYVKEVKDGDSIWLQLAEVPHFIKDVFPSIKTRFTLVVGDGEESFPSWQSQYVDMEKFVSDDRVLHIFGQNPDFTIPSKKISPLPLGLDFHSITRVDGYFGEPHTSVEEQEKILDEILSTLRPTSERKKRALIEFHLADTKIYGGETRGEVANRILLSGVCDKLTRKVPRHSLWRMKGEYAFSVSPHGGGLDCHRTWEDLVLGCIVIVKTSPLDPLYEGLPVVIVKDWSEITTENLDKWLLQYGDAFTNPNYRERLTHAYWMNKIYEK